MPANEANEEEGEEPTQRKLIQRERKKNYGNKETSEYLSMIRSEICVKRTRSESKITDTLFVADGTNNGSASGHVCTRKKTDPLMMSSRKKTHEKNMIYIFTVMFCTQTHTRASAPLFFVGF